MLASMPRSRASRARTGSVAWGPREADAQDRLAAGDGRGLEPLRHGRRQGPAGLVGQEGTRHGVPGSGEHVEQRPLLHDAPALDHRHVPGDGADHRHLVGDEQDREPELPVDPRQQFEDGARGLRVEGGGRLVGQQHLRRRGERAGDADALLLAPRQLGGVAVLLVGQADEIEKLVHPPGDGGAAVARHLEGQGDVRSRRCATRAG